MSRFVIAFVLIASATSALGASYKCKDASGNWTEQACPDYQVRQKKAVDEAAQEESLIHWTPHAGMTADEVSRVVDDQLCIEKLKDFHWCSGGGWCRHVNRTKNAHGTREQWVFGCDRPDRFLYFDNGILMAIQE